jgi:hypothetical protein
MAFNPGDKVTIRRGKNRGPAAIVEGSGDDYAVKTDAGRLVIVKAENIKAPDESLIGEGRLAAEIQTAAQDDSDDPDVLDALTRLVSRLSVDMPGLGARISWPLSEGRIVEVQD